MIFSSVLLTSSNQTKFLFSRNLDYEFLEKNYDENLELAQSIFESFMQNIDAELSVLNNGIEALDFELIRSIAHKIKHNFIYVGAQSLTSYVTQIEAEAKDQNALVLDTYKNFIENLEPILKSISIQLDDLKEHLNK